MAVEAPHNHANLFPPQFLPTTHRRDMTMMMKPNQQEYDQGANNAMPMAMPMGVASAMPEPLFPLYNDLNSINKADSGLTYHHHHHHNNSNIHSVLPCRKRSRDSSSIANEPLPQKNKHSSSSSSSPFLDQHLLYQFQSHQSEIDRLISQHTERVRMELEEQRVRQSRALLVAIQEAVVNKMKEKEQELQRIGKLNWALQERVRTLTLENQVWRELAHTNEATANSLRSNLQQVLHNNHHDDQDDAHSSCGSNHHSHDAPPPPSQQKQRRICKNCGEREAIVLLLPCRHLCLCTMCGSTVRDCPLCHSGINASVHVNLS